jgi:isoquinoline 1-oxidoreductase
LWRGAGVAVGMEKGGRVATCAEVRADGAGHMSVVRIVTAYECRAAVNPDTVLSQIEGDTVMAIGGALFESVAFDYGQIASPSLSGYGCRTSPTSPNSTWCSLTALTSPRPERARRR